MMGRFPYRNRWSPPSRRDRSVVEECMEMTGTKEFSGRSLKELSGGERQRVILAQAFAQEPKLLLLDEPTAHLDIGHQTELFDLIKKRSLLDKLTVIAILHDLNLSGEYCDKLFLLDRGKVHAQGAPQDVLTYQNIEQVYRTVVVVRENPISRKPHIVPISRLSIQK